MPAKQVFPAELPQPWKAFLGELDAQLSESVEMHCLGGFVLKVLYGLPRPTGDLDFISVVPSRAARILEEVAGRGSPLGDKYGLYLQMVTVADYPDDYEQRLTEICPGTFSNLRLHALEVHDLVLSKLVRNHPVDLEDAKFLSRKGWLDAKVLRARYENALRPYLANEARHDLTLRLWLGNCFSA